MTAIDALPPAPSPAPSTSIAQNLVALARMRQDKVSVQDIVETIEQGQGLAPVVFVLTLPVLLPMPPGVSMILALPLLVVAPQMMVLRQHLWMPERLGRQSMDLSKLQKIIARVLPPLRRVETIVHPRLTFLTARAGAVLAGAVCTLMAIILVLPLPFANVLPALTVLLFSLGITRRDGLAILLGVLLLATAITAIVWGLHGARLGLHHLFNF